MYDVIDHVREGNAFQVRLWLDNTENDLDQGDEHRFSLLHWAAKAGRAAIVDMLIQRGARVNATNMGDDTPLHLATAHGHVDVVQRLLLAKANVNAVNEHGNTALHYACFWNNAEVAEELVNHGSNIGIENKYGATPLEKSRPRLAHLLEQRARQLGHDSAARLPFKDAYWLGTKTRSRDATLSRQDEVDLSMLRLTQRLSINHGGEVWRGTFRDSETVAKILRLRQCTVRHSRDFGEEYPKLRIFNHPNVLAVLGAVNKLPNLIVLSLYMPYGSLYDVLHVSGGANNVVVDANQALRFAFDIANGMDFLHSPDLKVANFSLNSKHVMIDEDVAKLSLDTTADSGQLRVDDNLTAKLNMGDCKFSFHEKGREYNPAWIAPEALQRKPTDINKHAADMWSFGILLWELETRQVPFADLCPTEIGMKVALESLRVPLSPGMSRHMTKLVQMCCNENPGKRPKFDMLLPIFEKMRKARE